MTDPALIIFDVDGTLVDSGDIIFEALSQTLRAFSLDVPSRGRALKVVGLSLFEAFHDLTGDPAGSVAMAEHYKGLFSGLRAGGFFPEPLYPGADAVLSHYRARPDCRLGVATGKSRRGVDQLVTRLQWHDWFATIQTADTAPSKPHPAMVLQAMAETGAEPSRTVMIGDSVHDMRMAVAAGVPALGVAWGFHDAADLRDAGASLIVGQFSDIPAAVTALIG
ncbi:MAG: HAD-IA family hydrolase [Beijerinckiaceae bacterium]